MEAIWLIGTTVYSMPNGDVKHFPELEDFIAETAATLYEAESGLSGWLFAAGSNHAESDDMYRWLLRNRSAIEFLRDIYKHSAGHAYAAGLGTEDIDEEIRSRADQFNIGPPPLGVPRRHWWWGAS